MTIKTTLRGTKVKVKAKKSNSGDDIDLSAIEKEIESKFGPHSDFEKKMEKLGKKIAGERVASRNWKLRSASSWMKSRLSSQTTVVEKTTSEQESAKNDCRAGLMIEAAYFEATRAVPIQGLKCLPG